MKNMTLIALGRIAQMLLMFVTVKVATTLLPPSEMAKIFLVGSIVGFYALFLLNPVGMFMNRRIISWNERGRVGYYLNFFWMYLFFVSIVALITLWGLVGFEWIDVHLPIFWVLALVFGSLMCTTINQVLISTLNMFEIRSWFVGLSLASTLMGLFLAIAVVNFVGPSAQNWMLGLLVGQAISAVIAWNVFFKSVNVAQDQEVLNRGHINGLIKFAWPISIAVVLGWVQTQGYRFLMEASLGLHELGLFVAGYGISSALISAFESVFTAYLQPLFYKGISSEDIYEQARAWHSYATAIFPSLILFGSIIFVIAPQLTNLMLGPDYGLSSKFVAWGVFAEVARVASGVYAMIAHARMKTRLLLIPSSMGAMFSIITVWYFLPKYGSESVGPSLMLAAFVVFFITYMVTKREYTTRFPVKMIAISFSMGVGLFLISKIFYLILGSEQSFLSSYFYMSLLTIFYFMGQVYLLWPYISKTIIENTKKCSRVINQ